MAWCDLAENRLDSGRLFFEFFSTSCSPPCHSLSSALHFLRPFIFSFFVRRQRIAVPNGTRVKGNHWSLRFPLFRWRLANSFGKLPLCTLFYAWMTVLRAFDTAVCFEREIIWYVRRIRWDSSIPSRQPRNRDGRENRPFKKKRNRKIKKRKKKRKEKSRQRLKSFGDLASVHEGISMA